MNNIFGIVLTISLMLSVFFAPMIIDAAKKRYRRTDAKILLLVAIVLDVTTATCIICLLPLETFGKIVLCLLSVGTIILMTMFVLSLLFVATIPEEMEKEDERR